MTREIPLYDIGLGESLEVQRKKQKAIAETLGVDMGDGEKLFLLHIGFLVSSTRGMIPPASPIYEQELARYEEALCH